MELKGSKTEQHLKKAFAAESQGNHRYLYFAAKADMEGFRDIGALFRSTADAETSHAHGHLEYLEAADDPLNGLPIGSTEQNLESAIADEVESYADVYVKMAKDAREEGFAEIANWMETLAKAERSQTVRFRKALEQLRSKDIA